MEKLDKRLPIIVGVGQYKQQLDDVTSALEQYRLMEEAVRLAAGDAGCPALTQRTWKRNFELSLQESKSGLALLARERFILSEMLTRWIPNTRRLGRSSLLVEP